MTAIVTLTMNPALVATCDTDQVERGLPLEEAVLFGMAAGSAGVMTPGTQLCRREDAERLFEELKKHGY
jgi:fructose-1-phosphate kinase PfkB-like protein